MKSLTGGALLLVLGVPLALYAVLAVKAVARADLVSGDPPADRGASRDDLAKLRDKAGKWLGEVRKATTVAGQYRADTPEDASSDGAVSATIKAASNRAKNLLDADQFLSNTPNPKFEGSLAPTFNAQHAGRARLGSDEAEVTKWLGSPPKVTSADTAETAMARANELIRQYKGTQFADAAKAAKWRAEARLYVVGALAEAAEAQYSTTVAKSLPLDPTASEATKSALTELGRQVRALETEVEQARTDGAMLAPAALKRASEFKALAEDSAARKALLDLFAEEKLFDKPNEAAAWLKRVGEHYRRTRDASTRNLIRAKVQEFCEAFLRAPAQLDDDVLFKGKAVPRAQLEVKFRPKPGAAADFDKLSNDPNGLNEFTTAKRYPGDGTYIVYKGNDEYLKDFEPTKVSEAAVVYNAARAKVTGGPGRAKWTPNSLAELKKACEEKNELLNQLKVGGAVQQLWRRIDGLTAGAGANSELFGDQ
jgi:hypothetical protein